jgi:hypothetical protein
MKSNYDTIILELQKEGKAVASISMKKIDMEALQNSHNTTRGTIIDDMILSMEEGPEVDDKQTKLDL